MPQQDASAIDRGGKIIGKIATGTPTSASRTSGGAGIKISSVPPKAGVNLMDDSTILDALVDGVSIHDKDMRVIRVNHALCQMLSLREEQILGQKCFTIFHGTDCCVGGCPMPESIDSLSAKSLELFETHLGIYLNVTTSPLLDAEGKVTGVVHVARDVTARVKADQRLAESEQRYRVLIESSRDCICHMDQEGDFVYMTPGGLAGHALTLEQLQGMHCTELAEEPYHDLLREALVEAARTGETVRYQFESDTVDGVRWFDSVLSPLRSESGELTGFMRLSRDIHDDVSREREKARTVVAQRQELIGQLSAGIAHEINTPAQYVSDNLRFCRESVEEIIGVVDKMRIALERSSFGAARELSMELEGEIADADFDYLREQIPRALEDSLVGMSQVTTIVRAVRDFSHPGSREKVLTDMGRLVKGAVAMSANEWKYLAEVEVDMPESLPWVTCDPGDINQVVLNLIVNAAHAIQEAQGSTRTSKGSIKITGSSTRDYLIIHISDSGAGVPKEIAKKVFEPFFTTKPSGVGTGQGLALSKAAIEERHSGEISFDSTEQGTTFHIRLPLDPEDWTKK